MCNFNIFSVFFFFGNSQNVAKKKKGKRALRHLLIFCYGELGVGSSCRLDPFGFSCLFQSGSHCLPISLSLTCTEIVIYELASKITETSLCAQSNAS